MRGESMAKDTDQTKKDKFKATKKGTVTKHDNTKMTSKNATIDKSKSDDSKVYIFIGFIVVVAILALLTNGFGLMKSSQPAVTGPLTVNLGSLPPLGSANATVKIVEFSDFECPFCGNFYQTVEQNLRSNYVSTGEVELYFRNFPLTQIHQYALQAAVAAMCANDQGQFWNMHDELFANQNALDTASLEKYAANLGLDTSTFDSCLSSNQHVDEINADETEGESYGVQGTPGIFIIIPKDKVDLTALQSTITNGLVLYNDSNDYTVFVPGDYPYQTFQNVLNEVNYS